MGGEGARAGGTPMKSSCSNNPKGGGFVDTQDACQLDFGFGCVEECRLVILPV